MNLCSIVNDKVIYWLCKFQQKMWICEFFAIFKQHTHLHEHIWRKLFVFKLKTYQNLIRTNGPQNFSLSMMKAHDSLRKNIFLFSLCDNKNRVIAKKNRGHVSLYAAVFPIFVWVLYVSNKIVLYIRHVNSQ